MSTRASMRGTHRRLMAPQRRVPFSRSASFDSTDLREDLRFLLEQLSAVGFERVIVTDLTRPELGIPVVRVRVPGLSSFQINQRRVSWRYLRHLL